jgi:hypothetical protein
VPETNLDERFAQLRSLVDAEIARARAGVIAELAGALARMRAASNESEWNNAVLEAGRAFSGEPVALELIASLAALTAPSAAPRATDVSARRFAKVKIAEIQLYHAAAVNVGRASRDLYGSLRGEIDAARVSFREKFLTPANGTADYLRDYLHLELVRVLANDDAALLGPGYPGPMV